MGRATAVTFAREGASVVGCDVADRLAMTSQLLIALFIVLSIPVIGAGVALARGSSAPDTVLGFAILVGLGVAGAGWALLGRGFTRA